MTKNQNIDKSIDQVEDVRDSLAPGKGRGRPTDATWTRKARVPMTDYTYSLLEHFAKEAGVGYTQLSARLLESAISRLANPEKRRNQQGSGLTSSQKILATIGYGYNEQTLVSLLATFTEKDWGSLLLDYGFEPDKLKRLASFVPGSGIEAESVVRKIILLACAQKETATRLRDAAKSLTTVVDRFHAFLHQVFKEISVDVIEPEESTLRNARAHATSNNNENEHTNVAFERICGWDSTGSKERYLDEYKDPFSQHLKPKRISPGSYHDMTKTN